MNKLLILIILGIISGILLIITVSVYILNGVNKTSIGLTLLTMMMSLTFFIYMQTSKEKFLTNNN